MTDLPPLPGNLESLLGLIRDDVIDARPQSGLALMDGFTFWLITIGQEVEQTPTMVAAFAVTLKVLERLTATLDRDPPAPAEVAWSKRVALGALTQLHRGLADALPNRRETADDAASIGE